MLKQKNSDSKEMNQNLKGAFYYEKSESSFIAAYA